MARFVSPLLLTIALLAPGGAYSQSYCSGRQEITTAGSSVSSNYGRVVVIGDSLLAGRGNTQGRYEKVISEGLDNTLVVNNAVGGNSLDTIADSVACSCVSDCQWAIINGGINGHRNRDVSETVDRMTALVQRELDAGRFVIIQGYVPDCDRNASGETFDGFLDGYAGFASVTENVWFVDPRNSSNFPGHELIGRPCEDTENLYRADDLSHPSPLSGEVMGTAVADIIRSQSSSGGGSGGDDETETDDENSNENESDSPTPSPNENESDESDDENENDNENDNDNDSDDDETPDITVRPTLRPKSAKKAAKKGGKAAKKTNKKAGTMRSLRVRKVSN